MRKENEGFEAVLTRCVSARKSTCRSELFSCMRHVSSRSVTDRNQGILQLHFQFKKVFVSLKPGELLLIDINIGLLQKISGSSIVSGFFVLVDRQFAIDRFQCGRHMMPWEPFGGA